MYSAPHPRSFTFTFSLQPIQPFSLHSDVTYATSPITLAYAGIHSFAQFFSLSVWLRCRSHSFAHTCSQCITRATSLITFVCLCTHSPSFNHYHQFIFAPSIHICIQQLTICHVIDCTATTSLRTHIHSRIRCSTIAFAVEG